MTWVQIDSDWMNLDVFEEIKIAKTGAGQFCIKGFHKDKEVGSYEISSKVFEIRIDAQYYMDKIMSKAINGMD